jgi:anti-sigma factor RsiW
MDCGLIRGHLVGWYFGDVDEGVRESVEAHLTQCPGCLKEFLALKRRLEAVADDDAARPSAAMFERLRVDVEREFGMSRRARLAELFAVRIPLGWSLATAGAAVLLVLAVQWAGRFDNPLAGRGEGAFEVDSAREVPRTLNLL